jgi:hypothetical protein
LFRLVTAFDDAAYCGVGAIAYGLYSRYSFGDFWGLRYFAREAKLHERSRAATRDASPSRTIGIIERRQALELGDEVGRAWPASRSRATKISARRAVTKAPRLAVAPLLAEQERLVAEDGGRLR